ncbi:MAG: hypothetical protein WBF33_27090 [Candidatus Nitrosopolaris sp.]
MASIQGRNLNLDMIILDDSDNAQSVTDTTTKVKESADRPSIHKITRYTSINQ